jgi:hypothetical protein
MYIRRQHIFAILMLTMMSDAPEKASSVPPASRASTNTGIGLKGIVPLAFRYRAQIVARIQFPPTESTPFPSPDTAREPRPSPVDHSTELTSHDLPHSIMSMQC